VIDRVALVVHSGNPKSVELASELARWLAQHGIEVVEERPHLVLALGGDGTMLRAARLAHKEDALVLGVNFGSLGYLPEVEAGDEIKALERVLDGAHGIEERMMLLCDRGQEQYVGLNEVLVERASRHRLVRLAVKIGGEHLSAFNADGIIVATPTGSTAYALSAGGPIIDPRAPCLVVVPVSPHMIFSRPLVLHPDQTVEITVDQEGEGAALSLDGAMGCDLDPGARVVVRTHPRPLKLVKLSGPAFIERLRAKLNLPDQT
jgi:NAD+ kinase